MGKKIDINKLKAGIAPPAFAPHDQGDDLGSFALNRFKMRYYNIETEEPLPFDQIERRLKKTCQHMDRLSVEAIMDLYFLYRKWGTFYKRGDSFKDYLKKTLPISRSYAYDIIKTVMMLREYHEKKVADSMSSERQDEKESDRRTLFAVEGALERTGIRKLKILAYFKNSVVQEKILEQIFSGVEMSESEILELNRKLLSDIEHKKGKSLQEHEIKASKRGIKVDGNLILEYSPEIDTGLRKELSKVEQATYVMYAEGKRPIVYGAADSKEERELTKLFLEISCIKAAGNDPFVVEIRSQKEREAITRFLENLRIQR